MLELELNEKFYTKKMRLNPSNETSHVGFKIALKKWIGSVALKEIATKSNFWDMHYMFDKVNDMMELLVVIDKNELVFFFARQCYDHCRCGLHNTHNKGCPYSMERPRLRVIFKHVIKCKGHFKGYGMIVRL
jgi:hypothetical protein